MSISRHEQKIQELPNQKLMRVEVMIDRTLICMVTQKDERKDIEAQLNFFIIYST
jgi:hypothetical protein